MTSKTRDLAKKRIIVAQPASSTIGGPMASSSRAAKLAPFAGRCYGRRAAIGALAIGLLLLGTGCRHSSEPLPTLGRVGEFSLLDQQARAVTAETLRGKVWVAAFFFTRCPTICPRITRRMRALQVASGSQPALSLVSFSVDPENDSPQVLLEYAKHYGADLQTWSFLTGDLSVVKRTVVDGFKLALDGKPDPNAENGGIIHGSHLVLVDRALSIRGYYRTDDEDDMKRLVAYSSVSHLGLVVVVGDPLEVLRGHQRRHRREVVVLEEVEQGVAVVRVLDLVVRRPAVVGQRRAGGQHHAGGEGDSRQRLAEG